MMNVKLIIKILNIITQNIQYVIFYIIINQNYLLLTNVIKIILYIQIGIINQMVHILVIVFILIKKLNKIYIYIIL